MRMLLSLNCCDMPNARFRMVGTVAMVIQLCQTLFLMHLAAVCKSIVLGSCILFKESCTLIFHLIGSVLLVFTIGQMIKNINKVFPYA